MNLDDDDTVDELPARPRYEIPAADLELLELAARALGATFEEVDGEGYGNLHFEDGSTTYAWNPLAHSDDAFNLQVQLELHVFGSRIGCNVNDDLFVDVADCDGDPIAATRRAVTRAAAEIGKKITG